MASETLSSALEREHREIDAGIDAYAATKAPSSLRPALAALRRHIYLEEEHLFPPLRDGGLLGPIFVMLREHGEIWDVMLQLEALLEDPGAAAATCQDLVARLAAHNEKEESIVYPEVDKISQADSLLGLLGTARMPDDWVCERASGTEASHVRAKPRSLPS